MKKAVIYCRVSTEEQAQENHHSLDVQKRVCQEYALANDYEITKIYEDAGKSGSKMQGRNGLLDLIDYIQKEPTDAVFVQDTDRFARNTNDHLTIKTLLAKHGTRLISVSQPTLDDSAEGKMIDTIIASVNTFQSDITKRKTKKGLEQRAISGWFPTEAPIGYKNVGDTTSSKRIIVIDNEKAPLVKIAYEMYINGGYGCEVLNELLYEKGLRSKRGVKLAVSKLHEMLQNPFYYGEFRWDKKLYPGNHEPLISKEIFNLAQKIRQTRTLRKSYKRKHSFLLSGFMFCHCGRRFTAENHLKPSGLKFGYYHCTRGKKCTSTRNITCQALEKQVEEQFMNLQFKDDFYKRLLDKLKIYHSQHTQNVSLGITKATRKKEELEKKRHDLDTKLLDHTVDSEAYKRINKNLTDEIMGYESEINRLKKRKNIDIPTFEEIIEFSKDIYNTYKKCTPDTKRLYLSFFWEKFIVDGESIAEAIPTPLFQALKELQKPSALERAFAKLNDDLEQQDTKKFALSVINHNPWGGYRELNSS